MKFVVLLSVELFVSLIKFQNQRKTTAQDIEYLMRCLIIQHRQFHCVLVFCQMPLYPSDCKIRSTIAWLYWYDDERPKDATASFLNKKSEESGSKHRALSSQRIATGVSSSSLANSRCGCNYCFTASNAATDIRHCPRTWLQIGDETGFPPVIDFLPTYYHIH